MIKNVLSLIISVKAFESEMDDGYCRVLALRGGGGLASFEVGVLEAMTEKLQPQDVAYDVIEGVSAGSIYAGGLSLYPKGEEKKAV
jgi:predicted acylesterase/phospholipase RssA